MIEDSAQRRREANSGYRLEAMGSLSQNRGQLDAEHEFQSPGSFLNRSGRYENSGYQFEPLNSYPDRRHEGNFGSQFPPMSSFPSPNRRDENSDYRFEPLAFSAHLYDEDIEEDELSKKYIPREKFHVQRSGIKDPAPVGEMMRSADEYLNDLDQQSQGILPRAMAGIIFGYLRKMPGKAGTNIIENDEYQ
ncbi:hypothetical protein H4I95_02986 [Botrytis cinerea]